MDTYAVLIRESGEETEAETVRSSRPTSMRVRLTSLTRTTVKQQGRIRTQPLPQGDCVDGTH